MLQIDMSRWRFLSLSGAPVLISVHTSEELSLLALRVTQTCLVCRESTNICRRAGLDRAWWIFGGTASAAAHFPPSPSVTWPACVLLSWQLWTNDRALGGTRRPHCYWPAPASDSIPPAQGTTQQQPCPPAAARWRCRSVLKCVLRSAFEGNRQQPSDNSWRSAPFPEAGSGSNRVWEFGAVSLFLFGVCEAVSQSFGKHSQSVWPWVLCMWQCLVALRGYKAATCSATSGLMPPLPEKRKQLPMQLFAVCRCVETHFAPQTSQTSYCHLSCPPPASQMCVYVGNCSGHEENIVVRLQSGSNMHSISLKITAESSYLATTTQSKTPAGDPASGRIS